MTVADDSKPVLMLPAARWWASKGIPVFPLHNPVLTPMLEWACSCERQDCHSPAKHPRTNNGLHDASTDPATITAWWERWPEANIGLRTGVTFDLLDIDGPAGFEVLEQIQSEISAPLALCVVESGRADGGRHYYMAPPALGALQGGKTSPAGIDVKSEGGYVVAPPSQHITGYRYMMTHPYAEREGSNWPEIRAWLVERAPKKPTVPTPPLTVEPSDRSESWQRRASAWCRRALDGVADELAAMPDKSGRNDYLNAQGWRLLSYAAAGHLDTGEVLDVMRQAALDSGLSTSETDTTLRSAVNGAEKKGPIDPPISEDDAVPAFETVEQVSAEAWEPPRSLDLAVPAFPSQVLGWMAEPVERLADELQTPPDIVGMLLLATVAATVRGRAQVSVGGRWTEPLNLYVAVVAGAGETKSPALAVITKPLRDIEKALQETARLDVSKNEQARRIQKARLDAAERAAAKATSDRQSKEIDAEEARRLLLEMPELAMPRILASDATPEGMVQLLAQQGGVLAVLSAEGGLFDILAGGRYSSGAANLDAVLQAHDGREPILVDRKGSAPIRVEHPRLTLGLAVQPQVLESVGKSDAAVGRGFLARFLYSVPATRVGSRRVSKPVETEGFVDFLDLIQGVEGVVSGGSLDFLDTSLRVNLELSSSSSSRFYAYRESLEPRRHPSTGDLAAIRSWANKLDGQIVRLAGLLQLIYLARDSQNPENEVSVEALDGALLLADYLIQHAVAAHSLMRGDALATSDKAVQLLGWLRKNGHAECTLAEAHQALKGRLDFRKAEDVKEAADVLVVHGYLRAVAPEAGKPGRPSVRYLVNPLEAQS